MIKFLWKIYTYNSKTIYFTNRIISFGLSLLQKLGLKKRIIFLISRNNYHIVKRKNTQKNELERL